MVFFELAKKMEKFSLKNILTPHNAPRTAHDGTQHHHTDKPPITNATTSPTPREPPKNKIRLKRFHNYMKRLHTYFFLSYCNAIFAALKHYYYDKRKHIYSI